MLYPAVKHSLPGTGYKFAMSIGERIAAARTALGVTKADLARVSGVTRQAIGQLESGASKRPNSETLLAIAKALGQEPSWIISGRGKMLINDSTKTDKFISKPGYAPSERLLKDLDKTYMNTAGHIGKKDQSISVSNSERFGGEDMHEGEDALVDFYRSMDLKRKASLLRIDEDFATASQSDRDAGLSFGKRRAT